MQRQRAGRCRRGAAPRRSALPGSQWFAGPSAPVVLQAAMKLGLGLGWVSPDTDWASEPEIQGSVLSPSNAAFCRQLGITHIIGSGETPPDLLGAGAWPFSSTGGAGTSSPTRLPLPTAAPTATHPLRASRLTPPHSPRPAPQAGRPGFPGSRRTMATGATRTCSPTATWSRATA